MEESIFSITELNDYYILAAKLNKNYPINDQRSFEGKSAVKVRNFYAILRHLAENGSLTITEIVKLEKTKDKNFDSVYQIIYRVVNGSIKLGMEGLVDRELVVKDGKKYRLREIGIIYCIYAFADKELIKKYKNSKKGYASQVYDPKTILDKLAENYVGVFPLFLDKLSYLKKHQYINVYDIFEISSQFAYNMVDIRAIEYSLTGLAKVITALFYFKIHKTSYDFKINVKIIDDDVLKFLNKLCNDMVSFYEIEKVLPKELLKIISGNFQQN